MRQSITPPTLGNQSSFHAIPIPASFSSYEDVDSSSSLDDLSGQQDDCDTLPADDVAGEAHAVVVERRDGLGQRDVDVRHQTAPRAS